MDWDMMRQYMRNIRPKLCWECDGCGKGKCIQRNEHGIITFPNGWYESGDEIFCKKCAVRFGYMKARKRKTRKRMTMVIE